MREMTEVRKKENSYFIAANGYTGFRSRYDAVFRAALYTHVYIIKGGPGTGKNRMMQEIAQEVEAQGGQVDYIYCSSDPSSLDGVILKNKDKKIAVLDGTAPHTRCTELPGVADELVNLGAFWDQGCLKEQREEIVRLCQGKSAEYQMAYRYLSLAGAVDKLLIELLFDCVDHEKVNKSIGRTLRSLARTRSPGEQLRYYDACSMRGKLRFSSLPVSTEIICVDNYLCSGRFYLNAMRDALRHENACSYVLIPSCYDDERTDGIYLPNDNIAFLIDRGEGKHINMKRFIKKNETVQRRPALRRLTALHEQLTDTAVEHLQHAGTYHFALEEIYGGAMDFDKKEKCVQNIIWRILDQLF